MAYTGRNSPPEEGLLSPVLRTSLSGPGLSGYSLASIAEFNTPDAKLHQSLINAQSTPLLLTSLGINNHTAHESWQTCMATPPDHANIAPDSLQSSKFAAENEKDDSYNDRDSFLLSQTELNAITLLEEQENLKSDDVTLPEKPANPKRTLCPQDTLPENDFTFEKTTLYGSGPSKRGRFLYPSETLTSFLSESSNSSSVTTTPLRRLPKSKRALPFKAPRRLNDSSNSVSAANKSDTADFKDENLAESVTQFPSFATASGKKFEVSEKALTLTRKTLNILETAKVDNLTQENEEIPPNFEFNELKSPIFPPKVAGFTTASGKELKVSDKAMELARKTFSTLEMENIDIPEQENENRSEIIEFKPSRSSTSLPKMSGFATAGGKALKIDKERLKAAHRLYESVEIPTTIVFDSAPNLKEIENSNEIREPEFKENFGKETSRVAVGFNTAGGKALVVSAQNLKAAEQQFAHGDVTELLNNDFVHEFNDEDVLLVQNELDALEKAGSMSQNDFNPKQVVGFTTARGHEQNPSEKARKMAENLFSDTKIVQKAFKDVENRKLPWSEALTQEGVGVGFTSARGQTLIPSEKGKKMAENLFRDIEIGEKPLEEVENDHLRDLQERGVAFAADTAVGCVTEGGKCTLFVTEKAIQRGNELSNSTENENNSTCGHHVARTEVKGVEVTENVKSTSPPASPKLGRRRKKKLPVTEAESEFPDPSTESQTILLEADPTFVKPDVLARRKSARELQFRAIELKKGAQIKPRPGSLFKKAQNTIYKLKDLAPLVDFDSSIGTLPSLWKITASNAQEYSFSAWEHFPEEIYRENSEGIDIGEGCRLVLSDSNSIGLLEISNAFLASEGVDPALLHPDWLKNHYKWIVWKLACLERRFPAKIHCWHPTHVVAQLKYRYDREIDRSERSVLRKLAEQDDSVQKPMILMISAILQAKPCVLEVSDGWYAIKTQGDATVAHLVAAGKLKVGTKVVVQGAEFASFVEACHPLDLPDHASLLLNANSMRRVKWDAKMGVIKKDLKVKFETLLKDGGKVAATRAHVARCYPLLYVCKDAEGRKEFLSERAYNRRMREEQKREQELVEELYSQIAREFEQQSPLTRLEEEDFMYLSENERREKIEHLRLEQEKRACDIRSEVRRRVNAIKKDQGSVTPIWKLLLVSLNWPQATQTALVTLWRPTAETQAEVQEGATYDIYNLLPSESKQGSLRLTATYKTRFERVSGSSDALVKRSVCPLGNLNEDYRPLASEVDIVGVIASINPPEEGQQSFVIEDIGWHRALVYFKGDLESHSLDNLVKVGECVAGLNLTWKGTISNKYSLPCLVFQDVSHLTDRPSQTYLQEALNELRRDMKNSGRF